MQIRLITTVQALLKTKQTKHIQSIFLNTRRCSWEQGKSTYNKELHRSCSMMALFNYIHAWRASIRDSSIDEVLHDVGADSKKYIPMRRMNYFCYLKMFISHIHNPPIYAAYDSALLLHQKITFVQWVCIWACVVGMAEESGTRERDSRMDASLSFLSDIRQLYSMDLSCFLFLFLHTLKLDKHYRERSLPSI